MEPLETRQAISKGTYFICMLTCHTFHNKVINIKSAQIKLFDRQLFTVIILHVAYLYISLLARLRHRTSFML